MIIRLTGSAPPAEQIRDQIRGLVASGRLGAHDRMPSVRQLARDLDVAPGTVAKAYRSLEAEGYLTARAGGGTRVSDGATMTSMPVLEAARVFVEASIRADTDLDDAVRILRAVWPAG